MKNYNIVGWYGRNNCGDEAFIDAFDLLLPGEKFFSTSSVPAKTHILGGGDVIKPFYLNSLQDDEFFIVGAGLGYGSEIELLKGKRVRKALFRNKADVTIARINGIDADYIPDLVFALDPVKRTYPLRTTIEKKRAVVILNGAIAQKHSTLEKRSENSYADYFMWELASALDYLSEWYHIEFLPFSAERYNQDILVCHEVSHRMKHADRTFIFSEPMDTKDTMSVIANTDLVISMKFHGLIFSTICAAPFVNIGWSRKTHLFCNEHGFNNMSVEPFTFTKDRLTDAVVCAERPHIPQMLQDISRLNREQVRRTFSKFKAEFL